MGGLPVREPDSDGHCLLTEEALQRRKIEWLGLSPPPERSKSETSDSPRAMAGVRGQLTHWIAEGWARLTQLRFGQEDNDSESGPWPISVLGLDDYPLAGDSGDEKSTAGACDHVFLINTGEQQEPHPTRIPYFDIDIWVVRVTGLVAATSRALQRCWKATCSVGGTGYSLCAAVLTYIQLVLRGVAYPALKQLSADAGAERFQRPRTRPLPWRFLGTCSLLLLNSFLALLLKTEIANLPEHAVAGALLRVQLELAPLLHPPERPSTDALRLGHVNRAHTATRFHAPRARTGLGGTEALAETYSATIQVEPVKLLQPFRVEVVDSSGRKLVTPRRSGVDVNVSGDAAPSLLDPPELGAAADVRSRGGIERMVVLRAIIAANGRVEEVWKISGPAELAEAAIRTAKKSRYGPYYRNGVPTEMEAILTVTFSGGVK